MKLRQIALTILTISVIIGSHVLSADSQKLWMPKIFSNNMVLQRNSKINVWGRAAPKSKVTVKLASKSVVAEVASDGSWKAVLPALKSGGPHKMTVEGKGKTISYANILIGEVWICSGQSNMEWKLSNSADPKKNIAEAKYPKIRLFTVKRATATELKDDVEGTWAECSPATAKTFSAVAYYFGRDLHKKLDCPVGLIHTSWSGMPIQPFMSMRTLKSDKAFARDLKKYDEYLKQPIVKSRAEFKIKFLEWKKARGKKGNKSLLKPRLAGGYPHETEAYNGMIAPLIQYTIKGAIWYQGESNARQAYHYRKLFPAMIKGWREDWGYDFPFFFVQLANFKPRKNVPEASDWAELREAQSMTLSLPLTGQAVIIDIGEAKNIHPMNKVDVGKRLSLSAQKIAYKMDVVHSGPTYKSMQIVDGGIRLQFENLGSGLMAKGEKLTGFAIAGADKKFEWAEAVIEKDGKIFVKSDKVAKPVAVRYAWANNPECNLFNKEKLPASPFRTDTWNGVTFGK